MGQELRLWFDHGLGDVAHWVHLLELYKRRGYNVGCHFDKNKAACFEIAGVPWIPLKDAHYHQWPYLPGFNQPSPQNDWSGNKIALNFGFHPLPRLDSSREELWDELCSIRLSFESILTPELLQEAESFLGHLPRPIVLVHPQGTNMPDLKNIDHQSQLELYNRLLDGMDGSIIILDWDFRVAEMKHARVKHTKRHWGHLSGHQLAALMKLSDFIIGVDSGPIHFSAFSTLPALFVTHHHYPSCVSLPRPGMACMTRNADSYKSVNKARRPRWSILEYSGVLPTAEVIAKHALRMIHGPRYLDRDQAGRDVMLQQWVRDWMKGSTSTGHADRCNTMDRLLREMKRFTRPVIVETGCVRSAEDWNGAGNSSVILAAYAGATGGSFTSVDLDPANCAFARKEIAPWGNFQVVVSDSVKFLKEYAGPPISLLYLDSMDVEVPGHQQHGLAEFQAGVPKLADNGLVVIDDTSWDGGWIGKGGLAVPWALENGWRILSCGYQTILERNK